ncbi:MAG: DJ-1/PfpI family protein [Archangiaceae bacterium]|nr:DJ-1/PfpI family protein [Archangiaceae bacterium]
MRSVGFFVFPRVTTLDFVGVYDALRRLSGVTLKFVGPEARATDEGGLSFEVEQYPSLAELDLLVVPGGHGTRALEEDERCLDYLRAWGEVRPIASVCTGALLLGRAGHLKGLKATTHFGSYERLAPFCAEVVRDVRVVDSGRVVTAGAVSSSLDLGLHLVKKHWGEDEHQRVSKAMAHALREP